MGAGVRHTGCGEAASKAAGTAGMPWRRVLCVGATDKGPVRAINQDSYLIKRAQTSIGQVCLAAVADGMGGLSRGELASATVVRAFSDWFETSLPLALQSLGSDEAAFEQALRAQWMALLQSVNVALMQYGALSNAALGTTFTALFTWQGRYAAIHVGDTRLYKIADGKAICLTEDQTFAAEEVRAHRMSELEAQVHPRRNALAQCVGASILLQPVLQSGALQDDAVYLLCSDGFRHMLTPTELHLALSREALNQVLRGTFDCPAAMFEHGEELDAALLMSADLPSTGPLRGKAALQQHVRDLFEVLYARGERDNATALLVTAGFSPEAEETQGGEGAC